MHLENDIKLMIRHLEMNIDNFNNDVRIKTIELMHIDKNYKYYLCLFEENDDFEYVIIKIKLHANKNEY
jgi:hypothetical protein